MTLLLAALVAAAAKPAPPAAAPLTVAQVIALHEALDGQTVRVRGWLKACDGRSCLLQARRRNVDGPSVSLGPAPALDRVLRDAANREIVVEGAVSAACFEHPPGDRRFDAMDISVCADRADELRDPRLIAILPDRNP